MIVNKKLKVKELKSICKGLGIQNKGNKSELIKRIQEHEQSMSYYDEPNFRTEDTSSQIENTTINTDNIETSIDRNILVQQQDYEYAESLKQDILKIAILKMEAFDYDSICVDEIKIILESKQISFGENETIDTLLDKLKSLNEENSVFVEEEDDDIPLTVEELRKLRMRFYSSQNP